MFYDDTSTSTVSGNARMRSFSLLLSNCGLTQQCFFNSSFFVIMGFDLQSKFSCWRLWHENGHVFAKDKFVIFACSFASIAAALRRLSDCGLTQAEFYEIFEFLLYWVLVLYLSSCATNAHAFKCL